MIYNSLSLTIVHTKVASPHPPLILLTIPKWRHAPVLAGTSDSKNPHPYYFGALKYVLLNFGCVKTVVHGGACVTWTKFYDLSWLAHLVCFCIGDCRKGNESCRTSSDIHRISGANNPAGINSINIWLTCNLRYFVLLTRLMLKHYCDNWSTKLSKCQTYQVSNGMLRHSLETLEGCNLLWHVVAPSSLLSLSLCLFWLNDCLPARTKRGMAIRSFR